MDIRQQYLSMQGRFIGPWSLLSAPTFFFWRCKLHKVPDGKLLVAECRLSLFQSNSILNIGRHILFRSLHPSTGWFFDWSALKITKVQTLSKFWHLELFDGIYYVIWHLVIFRGGPVGKPPFIKHNNFLFVNLVSYFWVNFCFTKFSSPIILSSLPIKY